MSNSTKSYRLFLRDGINTPPRSPLELKTASTILGTSAFVEQMKIYLDGKLPDRDVPDARKLVREISCEAVIAAVSQEYGVSIDQIKIRGTKTYEPRFVAIYLCRKWVREPINDLGSFFGGVHGSAISKSVKKFREYLRNNADLTAKIEHIEQSLQIQVSRPDPPHHPV